MLIHGFAATTRRDIRGQVFTPDALSKCVRGAVPIRVAHDERTDIGELLEWLTDDFGLFIVARVEHEEAEDLIRRGLLHSFSVAGKFRADREGRISRLALEEISTCSNPACKGTAITEWTGDGIPRAADLLKERKQKAQRRRFNY